MDDTDVTRTDRTATTDGGGEPTDDARWLEDDVLDAPLPADVGRLLGRVLGADPVGTLDEWLAAVRERTGGGAIAVEDLCHTDRETPHWGELDGERHHFVCCYDAVALAALTDRPVEVHTESPTGEPLRFHATADGELTDVPEGAVLSFGIDESVPAPDGEPSLETVYGGVCPYVQAFPDRDACERWAGDQPAATVAMPLADASGIARALAE